MNLLMTLNRGAEEAAKEAKPIFINAIKQMTIQDAWALLKASKMRQPNFKTHHHATIERKFSRGANRAR